jgi:hypothetical protein
MVNTLISYVSSVRDRLADWGVVTSVATVVLLALVRSEPHLRAAARASAAISQDGNKGSVVKDQAGRKDASIVAPAEQRQDFELLVVGPGAKPIPGAVVEIATTPAPTASWVRKGKFVKQQSYSARVATGADGRLALGLPKAPEYLNVYITIPGYGPYWAGWSSETHSVAIPAQFTAELEPAWSVGGVIVDGADKPIAGVAIRPWIEFKKRPGERQQLGSGATTKSDATGKWHFDSVPVSMPEVQVSIDHSAFKPLRRPLARNEFGIEPGREPAARIVLDRGLTVAGNVTDEAGKPIVGALVRAQFGNEIRQAKSGANGQYTLSGCEAHAAQLVVSAKSRATDVKEVTIELGMGPVDFQMKPGGTVRVRVLEERGNPVPKARIFFQQWRGRHAYFEFRHVNQYADEHGVWVWNEAPLDEFLADICPPDGMTLQRQPLIARAEEYVFRVPGPLVVSGKVIDADNKKPIKQFQVVPGSRDGHGNPFWYRKEAFLAADGHYQLRLTRGESANLIRIEADGYRAADSRAIRSDEGTIAIDFELRRGLNVAAKVVTPRNLPAVGAKVALGIAGSQIQITNGEIDDSSTYCARADTDESGRFHFPAQQKDFQLVITHPSGFAQVKSTPDWELTRIIHLEPWCRVEGTFRIGKAPAAHVPLEIRVPRLDSFGQGGPSVFTQHRATTASDGHFVFERVIPGMGQIGRGITFVVHEGATEVASSCTIPYTFPAGTIVHLDLGGKGRPVVGRLQAPEGFAESVRWNFASMTAAFATPDPHSNALYYTATVDGNGGFRIDDMLPGEYSLRVDFMQNGAGRLRNYCFTVPPLGDGTPSQPVDLGMLRLEKQ